MKHSSILVYVDDSPVYVPQGSTVIQACEIVNVTIPRFCYHDLLEIAGNCRICLVEIEKSPKPQAACGLPVLDQIRIYTNTPLVKKAREGVLEFLLLNHPLDCPICDQGGECDLQNQAIKYGNTKKRFYKFKRGVEDKGLGPVVKTVITRCIHCTRCLRFAWEVAGVEDLGMCLRGNSSEIGTYVKKTFNSEVSGNIIDLCPVGALTSKAHAFKTRPWEVKAIHSIDISDSLGSNIIIESKRSQPIRIVPRPNKKINLEWLSDKARFIYEGFISIRLAYPYFFKNQKLYKFTSYLKTKESIVNFLKQNQSLNLVIGRNLDLETLQNGITLFKKLGGDFESETSFNLIPTIPAYFQSTIPLTSINKADSCLLIGVNPRTEATIANLRLRSRFKAGIFNIVSLGSSVDLTYQSKSLGLNLSYLYDLANGKHTNSTFKSKKPLYVYGDSLSRRYDVFSALALAYSFQRVKQSKNWIGILRLPLGSNSIGKAFYGLSKPKLNNYINNLISINYVYGGENNNLATNPNEKYIVETTHHSTSFNNCSFVLPQQSVIERNGSFINCTGLVQKSHSILRFGTKPLTYLKNFYECQKSFKDFKRVNVIFNSLASSDLKKIIDRSKVKLYTTPLKALLGDIYRTDRYTNASLTLAKVSSNSRKIYYNFI